MPQHVHMVRNLIFFDVINLFWCHCALIFIQYFCHFLLYHITLDLAKFTFVCFIVFILLWYRYTCIVLFTCRGGLGDDEQFAFRKWFRHIEELRSMFPSANLLAVSATCNKEIRRTVMKELVLQKKSTTLIIRSPDESNTKYYVKKIDSSIELSMQWLRIPWNWGLSADNYLCHKC